MRSLAQSTHTSTRTSSQSGTHPIRSFGIRNTMCRYSVSKAPFDSLYGGEYIPSNSDLSDYKDIGCYYVGNNNDAQTIINSPTTEAFQLRVIYPISYTMVKPEKIYLIQNVMTYHAKLYIRYYDGWQNVWSKWRSY